MKLHDLFSGIIRNVQFPEVEVLGLASNSYKIKQDYLFVALSKKAEYFIPQAISSGAIAVLSTGNHEKGNNAIYIEHHCPRKIYHQLAKRFYPQQPARIVAVTGTNGKTSVVSFYQQLLESADIKAASIGTIGVQGAAQEYFTNLTTPDSADIHCILHDLSLQGVHDVAIEASSHGLSQERMHSVTIKAAAFTNLSHDHFDYHGNYTAYLAAKEKLFSEVLPKDGVAVLNADIEECKYLQNVLGARNTITYGKNGHDIKLIEQIAYEDGQKIVFSVNNYQQEITVPILGKFQAYNILCALGLMIAVGHGIPDVKNLQPVTGRMQLIQKNGYKVVVDYAHTPDALQSALLSLRWHMNSGKLILVFGCGGDRDKTKRHTMGEVASNYADIVIVCDDNPRTENPSDIRKGIILSCPQAIEIGDRREAIAYAVEQAAREDIIFIAGKGHENKQIFSTVAVPFNDILTVEQLLSGNNTDYIE